MLILIELFAVSLFGTGLLLLLCMSSEQLGQIERANKRASSPLG
jgi:hypothetical protein